jgi:hypothetical protein
MIGNDLDIYHQYYFKMNTSVACNLELIEVYIPRIMTALATWGERELDGLQMLTARLAG